MGGDSKGGSADQSGMVQAMVAAQAANQAYQLGEQQFQWSKQVWDQMQPLVSQSEQTQIDLAQQQEKSLEQSQAEATAQWQQYQQYYAPLEQQYAQEAQNWASPQAMAQARGEAMADIGEKGMQGVNTAAETLRSYGINPGSARYASLYTSAQPMIGAAEAAAGTVAGRDLRQQQMQMMGNAASLGQNIAGQSAGFTQAGTGAGSAGANAASGAGQTAFGNLTGTGVGAGATSNLFNAGTGAMNSYVGAVNGYNQSQAAFNEAGAQEMGGFGSALGSVLGMGIYKLADGGPVGYDDGGSVGAIPSQPYDPRLQAPRAANANRANWAARQAYINSPQAQEIIDRANIARQGIDAPSASQLVQARYGATAPVGRTGMAAQPYDTRRIAPAPVNVNEGGGNPMSLIARPVAVGLQPTSPHTMSMPMPANTMAEQRGGPINRFAFGGAAVPGYPDYQATPTQGGGFTGIPSAPMMPRQTYAGGGDAGATPGGTVPVHASPSYGAVTDDVPAMLTAHEFVIPKDVAVWRGHQYFAKEIDRARKEQADFSNRDDIGGEPTAAIPQKPTFVSRPAHAMGGAIPGYPV